MFMYGAGESIVWGYVRGYLCGAVGGASVFSVHGMAAANSSIIAHRIIYYVVEFNMYWLLLTIRDCRWFYVCTAVVTESLVADIGRTMRIGWRPPVLAIMFGVEMITSSSASGAIYFFSFFDESLHHSNVWNERNICHSKPVGNRSRFLALK